MKESIQIFENASSWEKRLEQEVEYWIRSQNAAPKSKSELVKNIDSRLSGGFSAFGKLPLGAAKDAFKDIVTGLKGKIKFPNAGAANGASSRSEKFKKDVNGFHDYIQTVISRTFPDGDPVDYFPGYYRRRGWDDTYSQKVYQAAIKRFGNKYNSIYDVLSDMMDQYAGDNPDFVHPWK